MVIARVRAGEPEAYAELVRAHTGIAIRAARALGAGADAEDVVQQAFIKAYCSLGRFRDGSAFKPWLLSIVANETRNIARTAVRQRTLAGREGGAGEGGAAEIQNRRTRRSRRWSRNGAPRCWRLWSS